MYAVRSPFVDFLNTKTTLLERIIANVPHQSALNMHIDGAAVRNSGHGEEIKKSGLTLNNQINQMKIQSYTPTGCQLVFSISSMDISWLASNHIKIMYLELLLQHTSVQLYTLTYDSKLK